MMSVDLTVFICLLLKLRHIKKWTIFTDKTAVLFTSLSNNKREKTMLTKRATTQTTLFVFFISSLISVSSPLLKFVRKRCTGLQLQTSLPDSAQKLHYLLLNQYQHDMNNIGV